MNEENFQWVRVCTLYFSEGEFVKEEHTFPDYAYGFSYFLDNISGGYEYIGFYGLTSSGEWVCIARSTERTCFWGECAYP